MLTFYKWKSRSITQLLGQAILIFVFCSLGSKCRTHFYDVLMCLSCPFFEAKPQQFLRQNNIQNPKRSTPTMHLQVPTFSV